MLVLEAKDYRTNETRIFRCPTQFYWKERVGASSQEHHWLYCLEDKLWRDNDEDDKENKEEGCTEQPIGVRNLIEKLVNGSAKKVYYCAYVRLYGNRGEVKEEEASLSTQSPFESYKRGWEIIRMKSVSKHDHDTILSSESRRSENIVEWSRVEVGNVARGNLPAASLLLPNQE
ncbi:hypothetical protein C8Q75DRAFT_734385 [Abortiporus biennis]|nr:hypothetical protein C8Q75DRAFT_734385 [Abortiporus biennis]